MRIVLNGINSPITIVSRLLDRAATIVSGAVDHYFFNLYTDDVYL